MLDPEAIKFRRAARRAHAMQDAASRSMWSGGGVRIPDKAKAASKRACRDYDWRRA